MKNALEIQQFIDYKQFILSEVKIWNADSYDNYGFYDKFIKISQKTSYFILKIIRISVL